MYKIKAEIDLFESNYTINGHNGILPIKGTLVINKDLAITPPGYLKLTIGDQSFLVSEDDLITCINGMR